LPTVEQREEADENEQREAAHWKERNLSKLLVSFHFSKFIPYRLKRFFFSQKWEGGRGGLGEEEEEKSI
jgi:hypothetical protein